MQKRKEMEKKLQKYIGFYFIAILLFTFLGFYPSYFSKFPAFEGVAGAYHIHAFLASLWIVMLIAQAFLIRLKKYDIHRIIGRASYVVMPLLLFSFFLVVRAGYYRNINTMSVPEAMAKMTDGIPDIFYMGIMYGLAISFRKKTSWHLRFMTGTAYITTGPGLGRFLFTHFSPAIAGPVMGLFFLGFPLVWMVIDILRKRSPVPMLIILATGITSVILKGCGDTSWWQAVATQVVKLF